MSDEELKNLIASLAILHKENQIEFKNELKESRLKFDNELKESRAEFDERLKKSRVEAEKSKKEIDKQLKELGKQIGGLGNKFGSFTEGMTFPSMKKILRKRFDMDIIASNLWAKRNGKSLELDVFAYSNGERKIAYVVEVKSHLKEDGLQQMLDSLYDFPTFFPDHADKKLYGILAAVNIPDNMRIKVLKSGIYLANIHDKHFELQVPDDFKARNFSIH